MIYAITPLQILWTLKVVFWLISRSWAMALLVLRKGMLTFQSNLWIMPVTMLLRLSKIDQGQA